MTCNRDTTMQPVGSYDIRSAAETSDQLSRFLKTPPRAGIIAGTGLAEIAGAMRVDHALDYDAIAGFPVSTAISHAGRMLLGVLAGCSVVVMQGRFHLYEGYSPAAVTFPVRVFQALGIKRLVLVNAAGGLNPDFAAGDIMIIDDHINLTGRNPLVGSNEDAWGPRFPDMTTAYTLQLREAALSAAPAGAGRMRRGVYAGLIGPSLETPAEIRYLRAIGADAVGFSSVMETIAAVHAGMQVLGLSVITNCCSADDPIPADVSEIVRMAELTAPRIADIIAHVLERPEPDARGSHGSD
jgi:purine-nucleoside phosphorylase